MDDERVDAFLLHLGAERRLSPHTVEAYGHDLQMLGAFAAGRGRAPSALARGEVEAFVRQLMAEGRAPRSVARLVATVRAFYRYLVVSGHLAASPAVDVRAPRSIRTLPKFLTGEEVEALLAAPNVATPRGIRDRAMIELLYATGLRVSELVSLRPSDINLEEGFVTTVGKGRKERLVPIGDEAAAWVRRYMQEARPALLGRRSASRLFVNARGGTGLTRIGFWKILRGVRHRAWPGAAPQPARAPAFVRHPSARARRRPAGHPDDARPRRSVHHADLHAHPRCPPAHAV